MTPAERIELSRCIDEALKLLGSDIHPELTIMQLKEMRDFEKRGGIVNYATGDMAISQKHMDEKD